MNALELKLQAVVSHPMLVEGSEHRFSTRALSALQQYTSLQLRGTFFPLAIGIIVLIMFSRGNNLSILRSDLFLFFSWHMVWRILFYKHANIPLLSESVAATILRITSSKEQFSPVPPL